MKKRLRSIATQTRKLLENISHDILIKAEPSLAGLCGYASLLLDDVLKKKGYNPQIIKGRGHWFIKCEGYLIDITASQFGQPNVVVRDFAFVQDAINEKRVRQFWWEDNGPDGVDSNHYLRDYYCKLQNVLKKRENDIKAKKLKCLAKAREIREKIDDNR